MKAISLDWRRALAEFFVIVVGVLVALGLENLREERRDRALESEYLQRLEQDFLQANRDMAAGRSRLEGARLRGRQILPFVEYGDPIPADTITFLSWIYAASRNLWPNFTARYSSSAYQELVASGRFGLIRSSSIRAFLASDQQRLSAQTTDLLPRAYRDFVRGRLPVDLQERIRERCPVDEDYERCDVDLGRFQPGPLLRDLQGNQEIASDLNLALQQLSVVLSDLDNLTERRDSLLVLLHRESGGG